MKTIHSKILGLINLCSFLCVSVLSSTVSASEFECMLVQARLVESAIGDKPRMKNEFPAGEVVLEGLNFGANPTVYFGKNTEPATLTEVGRSKPLDSITLKLPQGTPAGTYKLVIQNTTALFLMTMAKSIQFSVLDRSVLVMSVAPEVLRPKLYSLRDRPGQVNI